MADEAAQLIQLLKCWLCDMQSGIVMEKNWTHSFDQYQVQALQFSVHLISLLSILLRCNGFAGIQKAVVDQVGSRLPNTDRNFFFSVDESLALGSALVLLLGPSLVAV